MGAAQLNSCPLAKSAVTNLNFMEHRAKLLDIAAFLDRLDRAADDMEGVRDFRMEAFGRAIAILQEREPDRARRMLELFSDHSTKAIESAAGMKGAFGASPEEKR
jgi:hypothetical protein